MPFPVIHLWAASCTEVPRTRDPPRRRSPPASSRFAAKSLSPHRPQPCHQSEAQAPCAATPSATFANARRHQRPPATSTEEPSLRRHLYPHCAVPLWERPPEERQRADERHPRASLHSPSRSLSAPSQLLPPRAFPLLFKLRYLRGLIVPPGCQLEFGPMLQRRRDRQW